MNKATPLTFRVRNLTRGTEIGSRVGIAGDAGSRRKGLLGRPTLGAGEGLWIRPCEAVHTFFMQFAIDLLYLDRKQRVRKIREAVGPWRMSGCLRAHSVLELPAGTVRRTWTVEGDSLEIMPSAASGGARARERAPAELVS